jgi:cyclopropane-fatty-acyl-phospholipid synthase
MSVEGIRGEQLLTGGARFASAPGFFSRLLAPGFGKILDRLDQGILAGTLVGHLPDGTTRTLGGRAPGFEAQVWLKDWRPLLRLASDGVIGWYQGYEAGEWETDDLTSMFAVMAANVRTLGNTARTSGPFRLAAWLAHRVNRNSKSGALRNISAHYDLGNDFYQQWLDPSMTYSSALKYADCTLEAAQAQKLEGISSRVSPSGKTLEIGCGWGALADHLAGKGHEITAISLSDEQLSWARSHTDKSIDFRKQDYRDADGQFDAIVSVEMVEALGREYWPTFVDCVARNLRSGGRAAIQYISMADDLFDAYASNVDFIQAYVFPGGMLIRTSEFRALAAERGLEWADQHDFGLDYAATLAEWRQRFDRAVDEGRLPTGFDDRFIRLWRFYLSYCEAGFRTGNIDVHQVTLVKN